MTNLIYVLISYYPKYLISIILYSLVNLDKLKKSRKKNTKKDSDSSTDDDSSSKISKNSNKQRKAKAKEESLMDHYKKIENNDVNVATVETDSDTEEPICQIKNLDKPVSNEALISEADRIARENLLNSSDSNGKFDINRNRIIVHKTSFKYRMLKEAFYKLSYTTICS